MVNEKPLVSICIPTYNRCDLLHQTIESMLEQEEFKSGKVEIVISDNTSTDGTQKLGSDYAEKYPNIFYFRNKENIKDRNFPLALARGSGLLRTLHNDTLVMRENGLAVLCEAAEKFGSQRHVIYFSNEERNTQTARPGNSGKMPFSGEILDAGTFLTKEGYKITWIGSFALWEDECTNIADDTDGCELCLWQVRKLLDLLGEKKTVVRCDGHFGDLKTPPKKDVSYGLYQIFYVNFLGLIRSFDEKNPGVMPENGISLIRKNLLYHFFTLWIIQWEQNKGAGNYSDKEDLKKLVFDEYRTESYWPAYLFYYYRRSLRYCIVSRVKKMIGR